jgi:hypothetical protein
MDAFGGLRRLTQLYSDTKRSCDVVAAQGRVEPTPELLALHLEFRIQRERLSAWGLEWSDDNVASEAMEAVARAGLTETVTSVLENIVQVIDEADRIRSGSRPSVDSAGSGKSKSLAAENPWRRQDEDVSVWSAADRQRYEQLVKDLTNSIDLLYDLSRTRKELRQGTYPSSGKAKMDRQASSTPPPALPPKKAMFHSASSTVSEETLVNPTRASTIKTLASMELPSRLDPSLLDLPDEAPPPYDSIGATLSSRMIAYLKQPNFPSSSTDSGVDVIKIPVLVEFAPFDPAYRITGVSPPSQRLDNLLSFYARTTIHPDDSAGTGTLSCLGFYEDPKDARFGLVYELPKGVAAVSPGRTNQIVAPTSLLNSLQASSRTINKDARGLPPGPSLDDKFRMAFRLVQAFAKMHNEDRFTHKDLNSGNIIFFPKAAPTSPSPAEQEVDPDFRNPYVTSFDLFTEYNLEKLPPIPARNIYRHLDDPRIATRTCHACRSPACKCAPYRFDIYALGLILLEIGLWMPLADFYKKKYSLEDFKHRIDNLWVTRLASRCGTIYMKVVQDMLSQAATNISDSAQRAMYNRWLSGLYRCCLLDDTEDPWAADTLAMTTPYPSRQPSMNFRSQQSWSPKASGSGFARNSMIPIDEEEDAHLEQAKALSRSEYDRAWDPMYTPAQHAAARVIQRAWRCSRACKMSFGGYKRKISIIQTTWRKRRQLTAFREAGPGHAFEDVLVESRIVESTAEDRVVVRVHPPVPRPKLRIHNVKLQPELLDQWHLDYQPRLERVVERALRNSAESCSIELAMVGETALNTRPTIFVTCSSTARVRTYISRRFSYDSETWDVKVRRGKIRRSKAAACPKSPAPQRSMVHGSTDQMPLNPYHQQRPLCGASIGAFVGKHLPPVSFGGIVDVDGELFGMTVHHLLDDPSDDEESVYEEAASSGATRSSGRHMNYGDDILAGSEGNPALQSYPTDSMFPLEISDDEELASDDGDMFDMGYCSDDDYQSEISESIGTQGDISGIAAGSRADILVTQPALDDVADNFFPCEEDRDEDHLDSHALGHVYASSGIKRWNRKGILHEIDWALLKLDEDRIQPCNLVQGGRRYYQDDEAPSLSGMLLPPVCRGAHSPADDEFPTRVARAEELGNLAVHSLGRTSGLKGGVIGPAMSSVRIYKRRSFSRSWYVMGDFGIGGDSGAWVIDNERGRVCGHVLAWCERNSIAYICPAEVLLDDMKRTLGAARICLPGSSVDEESLAGSGLIEAPPLEQLRISGGEQLPDMSRLGLGEANRMLTSRFNGSGVSPRMEMQRLLGSQIAR